MAISNIIIVDDHSLYRLGLSSVIEQKMPEVSIIAEYDCGEDLVKHLKNKTKKNPDLVMLDILMPKMNGVELAKIVREKYPKIKILMVSSEVSANIVNELLDMGVEGYLSKIASKKDLISALHSILNGDKFYGQEVAKIMYNVYVLKQSKSKINQSDEDKKNVELTNHEKKIIELLCEGFSAKKIAEKLFVSPRTIDNHKAKIMQKLNFHNTVELVKYAIREGIVTF